MAKFKVNKAGVMEYAGLAVGAIVASKVSKIQLPVALPPVATAAIPLVLGIFLASKKGFIGSVGKGMIATGGVKLIAAVAPSLGISGGGYLDNPVNDYIIEGGNYALAAAPTSNYPTALAGVDKKDAEMYA